MQVDNKILITGSNGYIANCLYKNLSNRYEITCINRNIFDLRDQDKVKNFFLDKKFNTVIHTAYTGGNRLEKDSQEVFDSNILMFNNLFSNKHYFSKFISFGSGAEIYHKDTPYANSKRKIADKINNTNNFFNIRIYAVFDENELDQRFIKSNIIRYIKKESMLIHQDKFMDFFYMRDLCKLVDHYVNEDGSTLSKIVECSYNKKYLLSDIAKIINNLSNYKVPIVIENEGLTQEYIGKESPDMNFVGLEKGIEITYNQLKKLF